jgi:hypothetical protein
MTAEPIGLQMGTPRMGEIFDKVILSMWHKPKRQEKTCTLKS